MSGDGMALAVVLDVEGTLARFGGDRQLFLELAEMCLEDAPPLFDRLKDAVMSRDAAGVRMQAHALKGLLGGCGGNRAAEAAQFLENAGQHQCLDEAPERLAILHEELNSLVEALAAYRASS
jgi:HPt (histidine-containing phosphotransfer) domain-containing protein